MTTLLKFRRLLETHKLGEHLFAEVGRVQQASGRTLRSNPIVDATIIGAAGSPKNQWKARDPEMHQTRKGKQWYLGAKLHIAVDSHCWCSRSPGGDKIWARHVWSKLQQRTYWGDGHGTALEDSSATTGNGREGPGLFR